MRCCQLSVLLLASGVIGGAACSLMLAQEPAVTLSACDAVSKTEVAEVLDDSVSDGRIRVSRKNVSVCSFSAPDGGRMSILLRNGVGPDWTAAQTGRMRTAGSFHFVPGLGDQAFLLETRENGAILCIFHGSLYLQVSLSGKQSFARAHKSVGEISRRILKRLRLDPVADAGGLGLASRIDRGSVSSRRVAPTRKQ